MNPYLNFSGNCRQAFDAYQAIFGARLLFAHSWGESPMAADAPGGNPDAIMHATLQFPDGTLLMGADCPAQQCQPVQGVSLSVNAGSIEEAERLFAALSQGGQVTMPLEPTFWAARFGMCTDAYGVPWMVNCEMRPPE
ncbi:MAG: VOC family protein [Pseudoxanthomonas suwonensis]|nr:MAG: VOC family protein [Pseudoxanthomonas suwonensis]